MYREKRVGFISSRRRRPQGEKGQLRFIYFSTSVLNAQRKEKSRVYQQEQEEATRREQKRTVEVRKWWSSRTGNGSIVLYCVCFVFVLYCICICIVLYLYCVFESRKWQTGGTSNGSNANCRDLWLSLPWTTITSQLSPPSLLLLEQNLPEKSSLNVWIYPFWGKYSALLRGWGWEVQVIQGWLLQTPASQAGGCSSTSHIREHLM